MPDEPRNVTTDPQVCEHPFPQPAPPLFGSVLALFGFLRYECDDCGQRFNVFDPLVLGRTALWVAIAIALVLLGTFLVEFLSQPDRPAEAVFLHQPATAQAARLAAWHS